jgi:hypothetical protein
MSHRRTERCSHHRHCFRLSCRHRRCPYHFWWSRSPKRWCPRCRSRLTRSCPPPKRPPSMMTSRWLMRSHRHHHRCRCSSFASLLSSYLCLLSVEAIVFSVKATRCRHSGLYWVIDVHSNDVCARLFSEEARHLIFKQAQLRRTLISSASLVAAMDTVATGNADIIIIHNCCDPQ